MIFSRLESSYHQGRTRKWLQSSTGPRLDGILLTGSITRRGKGETKILDAFQEDWRLKYLPLILDPATTLKW